MNNLIFNSLGVTWTAGFIIYEALMVMYFCRKQKPYYVYGHLVFLLVQILFFYLFVYNMWRP